MKKRNYVFAVVLSICICACGQPEVELPDDDITGACGDWYPGGEDVSYGFSKDATLPCLEWGSVRRGPATDPDELYVNMAELNTWYRYGEDEKIRDRFGDSLVDSKALIIAISQESCMPCGVLLSRLSEARDYFFENGVIMVGVCGVTQDYSPLTPEMSDYILIQDDGWQEDLPRTHDPELNLPGYTAFPQMLVVTLFDMKIIHTYDDAGSMTPQELVSSIETAATNSNID